MVLTPKTRVELTSFQRDIVSMLESRIDEHIRHYFCGRQDGVVRVYVSDYQASYRENFNDKVRNEITKLYGTAGWNVRYLTEKKDQVIELTPKKDKAYRTSTKPKKKQK